MSTGSEYELTKNVDRYLAALSKLYGQNNKTLYQSILVNARVEVREEWSYDNIGGGIAGHALFFFLEENIFLSIISKKDMIARNIVNDLNTFHNSQHEHFATIFLEMEFPENDEWRRESGLLQHNHKKVTSASQKRIWEDNRYRVFLSHKAEHKEKATELKQELESFGISAFVAHVDIHPTREWQNEIENALITMDHLVALMTGEFHQSSWTDQEIGFALGRGVPILPVRMGSDPYGFIGKYQAVTCSWEDLCNEIIPLLMKRHKMKDAYIQAMAECQSYDQANTISHALHYIDSLSLKQIDDMIAVFNENSQIRNSYGFNGTNPIAFEEGLPDMLSRISSDNYEIDNTGMIIKTS